MNALSVPCHSSLAQTASRFFGIFAQLDTELLKLQNWSKHEYVWLRLLQKLRKVFQPRSV